MLAQTPTAVESMLSEHMWFSCAKFRPKLSMAPCNLALPNIHWGVSFAQRHSLYSSLNSQLLCGDTREMPEKKHK
jgi:hypothetical protein